MSKASSPDNDIEMQNASHLESDSMHPIAILMDELKDTDASTRSEAIKRLSTIALALGSERTRAELIPFIQESLMDEEDEILYNLAEELGNFVPLVGGSEYGYHLLYVLETLCAAEEPAIRSKAVESMGSILHTIPPSHIEEHFLPLLQRLSSASWYTNRMSAASLYCTAYELFSSSPSRCKDLITMFVHLVQDDTPMVRRAAATYFPDLLSTIKKDDLESFMDELFPSFLQIVQDEQDSVRLLSVKILITFAGKLTKQEHSEQIFPIIETLFMDKSWRVRFVVAELFSSITKIMQDRLVDCVNIYVQYIQDYEAEVRTAALSQLEAFCSMISKDSLEKTILPALNDLLTDPHPYVRASLANQVDSLAPLLGKDASMELLMPLLMKLLSDEHADVRLNVISKLEKVNEVVGIQVLAVSILPAVIKLSNDKQWRVRLAIVENIPILASQLGIDFFNDSLLTFSMNLLSDRVFAVREASIETFRKIISQFGIKWAKDYALSKIMELSTNQNYLYRMTTLFTINAICDLFDASTVEKVMLPSVLKLAQDPVANVRFNSAKTLEKLAPILKNGPKKGSTIVDRDIKPVLEKLVNDRDIDVQYYAAHAKEILSS